LKCGRSDKYQIIAICVNPTHSSTRKSCYNLDRTEAAASSPPGGMAGSSHSQWGGAARGNPAGAEVARARSLWGEAAAPSRAQGARRARSRRYQSRLEPPPSSAARAEVLPLACPMLSSRPASSTESGCGQTYCEASSEATAPMARSAGPPRSPSLNFFLKKNGRTAVAAAVHSLSY